MIVRHEDSILFELRSDSDRWSLIGGGIEPQESLKEAAMRELYEETGIEAEEAEMIGMFTDPSRIIEYPDGNIFRSITYLFRTDLQPSQSVDLRVSEESKQLQFVPVHKVRELDIVETHRHIIQSYIANPGTFIFE